MIKLIPIIIYLLFLNVSGRIYSPTLNKLVQDADWVGVVNIAKLDTLLKSKIVAKAKVEKIYKGKVFNELDFWAYQSYSYYVEDTELGQKCIVFLNRKKICNSVVWSGIGKFNVTKRENFDKIELSSQVLFPFNVIAAAITDTIQAKWGKIIKRYVDMDVLEKSILSLINKPGQYLWNYFITFDMCMWEAHVSEHNDLTKNEIKTVFDGEINEGTTKRILFFMIGSPRYIASGNTYTWWKYTVRRKDFCFRIDCNNLISNSELPNNLKWEKNINK